MSGNWRKDRSWPSKPPSQVCLLSTAGPHLIAHHLSRRRRRRVPRNISDTGTALPLLHTGMPQVGLGWGQQWTALKGHLEAYHSINEKHSSVYGLVFVTCITWDSSCKDQKPTHISLSTKKANTGDTGALFLVLRSLRTGKKLGQISREMKSWETKMFSIQFHFCI